VGYPDWWDHNRDPRKKNAKMTTPIAAIVKTHGEINTAGKASYDSGKFFNISAPVSNSAWIIYSGASDHMTFDSSQVSLTKPSSKQFVSTTNGTSNSVRREGSIPLTNDLSLDFILVVPFLNYNLLSVSQITTALFCIVIFCPNSCVFKDIRTRQTIGYGIKRGMLYHLDLTSKSSNKLRQALAVAGSQGKKKSSDIWLWHR